MSSNYKERRNILGITKLMAQKNCLSNLRLNFNFKYDYLNDG